MMTQHTPAAAQLDLLDQLDMAALQRRGSLKWTEFPGEIGAFIAEMDFGLAPPVHDAIVAAVAEGMTGYLPKAIRNSHAEATVAWLRDRYGWQVQPERVHQLADVVACLDVTIRTFSDALSPVIVPTPAYSPFLQLPQKLGREIVELPLTQLDGRWVIDPQALDAALAPRGGLLILCNPANPTGTVYTRDELVSIAEVVERRGGRVFADEVHAPLLLETDCVHTPYASVSAAARHTITGTSAAKAWNIAGLKCAQLITSNDADEARWQAECLRWENGASVLGVIANTAAYREGAAWLDRVLLQLRHNRDRLTGLLAEQLPGIRATVPQGTYLSWLDCSALQLPGGPAHFLHEHAQVAVIDGAACGTGFADYLRFNFATPTHIIEQAVARITDAIAQRADTIN